MLLGSSTAFAGDLVLMKGTTVVFASEQQAAGVLGAKDDFVKAMSPFDRSARMKTDKEVSEDEFLAFAAKQAQAWTKDEIAAIEKQVESIGGKLTPLGIRFPEIIFLIKTSGKEEGNAAYTRGNAVVLPASDAASLDEDKLIHELFHIFSRNNPDIRKSLYPIIGFSPCNEIALPEQLRAVRITNPDAPEMSCRIELMIDKNVIHAMPILTSRAAQYDTKRGGEFFAYISFALMQVEERDGKFEPCKDAKGNPVLLSPSKSNYMDKVGRNTGYIIHPEEILADNFVILANSQGRTPRAATPSIPEAMRKSFREWADKSTSRPASNPTTKPVE